MIDWLGDYNCDKNRDKDQEKDRGSWEPTDIATLRDQSCARRSSFGCRRRVFKATSRRQCLIVAELNGQVVVERTRRGSPQIVHIISAGADRQSASTRRSCRTAPFIMAL